MLAAEYVLGTLPAGERAAVALRARSEPPLAAAIEAWERRLAPLAETIAPREAPATIWPEIEARIDALEAVCDERQHANVVGIERRLRRWRAAAVAASALAASLLLFVGVREFAQPARTRRSSPCCRRTPQSPAFLVSVDLDRRHLTIRAVAAKPQPRQELRAVARPRRAEDAALARHRRRQTVHRGADARGLFAEGHRGRDARRQPRARRRLAHRTPDRSGAVCRQAACRRPK